MADEDEFPPYGPVPDEKRRPLYPRKPWKPESRPLDRPMLSQPVTSHKLLDRSTERERPNRATSDENKLTKQRIAISPTRQRVANPLDEVKQRLDEIDEEERNRLIVPDGYSPIPPRPRDGFGLQLRPKDPNNYLKEYFTGPEWYDPRAIQRGPPYVDVVESQPLPPPSIVGKPKPRPKVVYRKEGEKVSRPEPPAEKARRPEPPSPDPLFRDGKFTARNIQFQPLTDADILSNAPAKFDGSPLPEINIVAKFLREHPDRKVVIKPSVGFVGPGWSNYTWKEMQDYAKYAKKKRAKAVIDLLEAQGINRARMIRGEGETGASPAYWKVEFELLPR